MKTKNLKIAVTSLFLLVSLLGFGCAANNPSMDTGSTMNTMEDAGNEMKDKAMDDTMMDREDTKMESEQDKMMK